MNKLFLVTVLLTLTLSVFGQDSENKSQPGNGLYILPTQLIFPEVLLTYEQFIRPRVSISYSLGYKLPVGKGDKLQTVGSGMFADYEYGYIFNEYSGGIYVSLAPSFYDKWRKFYFQPELFYRSYRMNDKRLSYNNIEGGSYNSLRSEKIDVIGLKLLMGFNNMIALTDRTAINIKAFGGLGIRVKSYSYQNIDNQVIQPDDQVVIVPFEEESGNLVVLSFQLGVKIGVSRILSIK